MQIFTELNENKNLSLALGFFDGVHRGHKKVIDSAVNYAKENGLKSAVITFKDHPCCHFYGVCPQYILSRTDREKQIESLGIDYLYELDFNDAICSLTADEYLEQILVKNFAPKSISTGFNHFFGAKKSGNVDLLTLKQQIYNYKYFEIPPQKTDNQIISSTAIRNYIKEGKLENANSMLGHNFSISGKIIEGQKLGRKLGFRTANILYPKELVDLPFGVYSVVTNYGKGIANFGIRPTVNKNKDTVLETHILNFDKDIYGEFLEIKFLKMIRPEQKFNSINELQKQIITDISKI